MSIYLDINIDQSKIPFFKKTNELLRISDDLSIEKNKNLIIVYCPPKVGSTTLVSTIRLMATELFTVLHIHNEQMLKVLCNIENVTICEIINYNRFIGKNVYVIDIYRSPIEQKISFFFENICSYHFNNTAENINNYNVDLLISRFNSLFPFLSNDDYYRNQYNIPIIPQFDFTNKYLIQTINGIKFIKMRLNDVLLWPVIIKSILDINITIVTDYETENKPINKMYNRFKQVYRIPTNLLSSIENDELVRYYLTDHERIDYLNRWRQKQNNEISYPYSPTEFIFYNKISSENKYMSEIQEHHYIDVGCNCIACSSKRKELIQKINKGEKLDNNDKIIHEQLKTKYIRENIHSTFNMKPLKASNKSKNILRNTFTNNFKGKLNSPFSNNFK